MVYIGQKDISRLEAREGLKKHLSILISSLGTLSSHENNFTLACLREARETWKGERETTTEK